MPPKVINQHKILIPKPVINNNDGSKLNKTLTDAVSKPINSFFGAIENNLIIIGGVVIGVVVLIFRKN
jgi:hypothetical protein